MPMSERLRELTSRNVSLTELQKNACAEGMITLQKSAIEKLLRGVTTFEEVIRVTLGER
jgi:type II secretory ATPase GspE/PulE/Tfp pilus assembly ATPase PilB-like protein